MPPLYTLGHSTRSADELVAILRAFGVTRLVDIRSIPRSRTNPQFDRDVLQKTLARAGIGYVHLAALGGRRPKSPSADERTNGAWEEPAFHNYADFAGTSEFRRGLRELLAMTSRETCAILCAEAVWWRCHRRIVTDHVLAHGVPVVHLFDVHKSEPASLTPFAVVGPGARVTYPARRARRAARGAAAASSARARSAAPRRATSGPRSCTRSSRRSC